MLLTNQSKLTKISKGEINSLILKIAKLGSYTYITSNKESLLEELSDIKKTIANMTEVIVSYNNHGYHPDLIIDPDNKDYDPMKVFQEIIFPVYRLGCIVDYYYAPNLSEKSLNRIRDGLLDKNFISSCLIDIKFANKWQTEISINFSLLDHYNFNNGDVILPIDGLNTIAKILTFKNHVHDIFKLGDVYVYIDKPKSNNERKVYLAFKNSSIVDYDEDDGEDENEWDDNEPFITTKPYAYSHIVDCIMRLIKESDVNGVTNRFNLNFAL